MNFRHWFSLSFLSSITIGLIQIFEKYDLNLQSFYQTYEKQTIATRLMTGLMKGDLEPSEVYYVGGPNTVRGYREFPNSFASGDKQIIGNLEYRFIFNDVFQALLFIDAGWAPSVGELKNGKLGKGFGFRFTSPLGPMRLDFGFSDKNDLRIHFNIGHIF